MDPSLLSFLFIFVTSLAPSLYITVHASKAILWPFYNNLPRLSNGDGYSSENHLLSSNIV